MNKRSLFDIQYEYLNTLEELEEYCLLSDTDEVPDELMERLNINKDEMKDKLENYRLWLNQLDNEIAALKAEEDRLKKKRKSKERTIERLYGIMEQAIKMYGTVNAKSKAAIPTKYVETNFSKFTFVYKPKLEVDESVLIDKYMDFKFVLTHLNASEANRLKQYLKENLADRLYTEEKTPDKSFIISQENPESIPDELMERLNINKDEMKDKLENYRLWLNQLDNEMAALKAEEDRLKKKRKNKERTIERLS